MTDTDIDIWIRLSSILPLLAEAAPQVFLNMLAELSSSAVFRERISITDSFGLSKMTEVLWALECLAWFPQYFPQAVAILGDLSQAKLPDNLGNRPERSLQEIFCIWKTNTCADTQSKAKQLVRLAEKHPLLAWKIIMSISPYIEEGFSWGTYMPRWRELPHSYDIKNTEFCSSALMATFNKISSAALNILLEADVLPPEELIKGIPCIPDKIDLILKCFTDCQETSKQTQAWELLSEFLKMGGTRRLSEKHIADIASAIDLLAPTDKYEHFKAYFDHVPCDNSTLLNEEQFKNWYNKQNKIVESVFRKDGVQGILRLASLVKVPSMVGQAFASFADTESDAFLIHFQRDSQDIEPKALNSFLVTYMASRYKDGGAEWLTTLWNTLDDERRLSIVISLPFSQDIWSLVENLPIVLQSEYWQQVFCDYHYGGDDLEYPLRRLMEAGRNGDALQWLAWMMQRKRKPQLTVLKKLLLSPDNKMIHNHHTVLKMIEYLWNEFPECDEELARIEFVWIQLFHCVGRNAKLPRCLNRKLLTDPVFFVESLCVVYKPRHKKDEETVLDEISQQRVHQFYDVLACLRAPENADYYSQTFTGWLNKVLDLAKEHDRYEIACQQIGKILFYAPPDTDGFWINKTVAKILDEKAHEHMRHGFDTESFTSRGVYGASGGKKEEVISKAYASKAIALREEGFYIFATCLDNIAKGYSREAKESRDSDTYDF